MELLLLHFSCKIIITHLPIENYGLIFKKINLFAYELCKF
jgi:hypothetical protein